jgi:hypothetical protein
MPTRRRRAVTSIPGAYTSVPPSSTRPVTRALGMVSFIRLRQRRKVDLPQPDGPMSAVIRRPASEVDTSARASRPP